MTSWQAWPAAENGAVPSSRSTLPPKKITTEFARRRDLRTGARSASANATNINMSDPRNPRDPRAPRDPRGQRPPGPVASIAGGKRFGDAQQEPPRKRARPGVAPLGAPDDTEVVVVQTSQQPVGGRHPPTRRIILTRVTNASEFDLEELASRFGRLESLSVDRKEATATLVFLSRADAEGFIAFYTENELIFNGQSIGILYAPCPPLSQELQTALEAGAMRSLFMFGLPSATTEEQVAQVYGSFGTVSSVSINHAKRIAFVNFLSLGAAVAAQKAMDGASSFGTPVPVKYAKEEGKRPVAKRPGTQPHGAAPTSTPVSSAAPGASGSTGGGNPQRSVYLGNLDTSATLFDVCSLANLFGMVELARIVPPKSCAFINFVDPDAARKLIAEAKRQEANNTPLQFGGKTVNVRWAKSSPMSASQRRELMTGASRCLIVTGSPSATQEEVGRTFSQGCTVVNVILNRPQPGLHTVEMASIQDAATARRKLRGALVHGRTIGVEYGQENCPLRDLKEVFAEFDSGAPATAVGAAGDAKSGPALGAQPSIPDAFDYKPSAVATRAVLLRGCPPDAQYRDICNLANMHGRIQRAALDAQGRRVAIVFLDTESAQALVDSAARGIARIRGSSVQAGYAECAPMTETIRQLIDSGASRNIFVGNVGSVSRQEMHQAFGPFGNYESIITLESRGIAFVNMVDIEAATRARDALQGSEINGRRVTVNYAKEKLGPNAVGPSASLNSRIGSRGGGQRGGGQRFGGGGYSKPTGGYGAPTGYGGGASAGYGGASTGYGGTSTGYGGGGNATYGGNTYTQPSTGSTGYDPAAPVQ